MIKSMTGYYKCEHVQGKLACNLEVRSVNHRFLEARISLPRPYQMLEEPLKRELKRHVNRGKLDISISMQDRASGKTGLQVDQAVLAELAHSLSQVEGSLGRKVELDFTGLMAVKGLMVSAEEQEDQEEMEGFFAQGLAQVCQGLLSMRSREGELLHQEITSHVDFLRQAMVQITPLRDEAIELYKEKLKTNLQRLDLTMDSQDPRLMQEIGIFMDKCDVTEELERFATHLTHLEELLAADEPVGRKLDFLLQELNREANTLCSKSGHAGIAKIGVEIKAEIEKVREQVQNIE